MVDPKKKRYFYMMLAGFGAISMSIVLFFLLYRLQGIGEALDKLMDILGAGSERPRSFRNSVRIVTI